MDEVISMLCERCGKGVAEVHLVKIFNGRRYDENLCRSCAKEVLPDGEGGNSYNSLKMSFSPEALAQMQDVIRNLLMPIMSEHYEEKEEDITCPHCGKMIPLEYLDDFESMDSEDIEEGMPAERALDETEKLDLQMKKAVQEENYELAAKIRDKLAELKKANL